MKLIVGLLTALWVTQAAADRRPTTRFTMHADYDEFRLWTLNVPPGDTAPTHRFEGPVVVLFSAGVIMQTTLDGRSIERVREIGDVEYLEKADLTALGHPLNRALSAEVIELRVSPRTKATNGPAAAPRADAEHVFENDRIAMWSWTIVAGGNNIVNRTGLSFTMWLDDGTLLRRAPARTPPRQVQVWRGTVSYGSGDSPMEESTAGTPIRALNIQIK